MKAASAVLLTSAVAASTLAIGVTPVTAQRAQSQTATSRDEERQAVVSPEAAPDDVIVEGLRDQRNLPTRVATPAATSPKASRKKFEFSQRIAGCAGRSRLSGLGRLRAVVDGAFNSATQAVAQDRLKRIYITCGDGAALLSYTTDGSPPRADASASGGAELSATGPPVADAAPLGHSIYDRGAFVIEALKRFAPDLVLTRAQTADPAVQSRFNLREVPRNRFRLKADYRYFEIAVCMVRLEPQLSVRLAIDDTRAEIGGVQAALINRARRCVGNAKRVSVDPVQFRIYIADAVYRWAVAARGVESLIPQG